MPDQPPDSDDDSALPPNWKHEPAAIYGLEQAVRCPTCREDTDRLFVVRMWRARVTFVSSLPRSGRVLVCPHCRSIVPGELGAVL